MRTIASFLIHLISPVPLLESQWTSLLEQDACQETGEPSVSGLKILPHFNFAQLILANKINESKCVRSFLELKSRKDAVTFREAKMQSTFKAQVKNPCTSHWLCL